MRKEASVYLGIFSVSSIKNTFNKLLWFFFFLRMFTKPFGGSSWLWSFFFFLPLYFGFIFAFLVCVGLVCVSVCVCVCVCELLLFLAF